MSKNRFKSTIDEDTMSIMPYLVVDREECFYNLQGCVDLLNEQQSIIDEQKIAIDEMITNYKNLEKENEQLRKENVFLAKQRNYWKGIGKASVMKYLKTDEAKKINELEKENEQLKNRLYDFEKRKIIEESEIDEDIIPKIRLLRTELFGEKYE